MGDGWRLIAAMACGSANLTVRRRGLAGMLPPLAPCTYLSGDGGRRVAARPQRNATTPLRRVQDRDFNAESGKVGSRSGRLWRCDTTPRGTGGRPHTGLPGARAQVGKIRSWVPGEAWDRLTSPGELLYSLDGFTVLATHFASLYATVLPLHLGVRIFPRDVWRMILTIDTSSFFFSLLVTELGTSGCVEAFRVLD
ncbi:hypothetical protein BGW80DRAFT_1278781, partial [Lactifluus volemus]